MNSIAPLTEAITPDDREKFRLEQIMKSLHSLLDDDEEEQKDTFAYLEQSIDEDRLSTRKRFRSR